jgi:hypothetical protein
MTKRSSGPLCAVRVGFEDYILPLSDGLSLVRIMERAQRARPDYLGSRKKWLLSAPDDQSPCELTTIRADDVILHADPVRQRPRLLPAP